MTQENRRAMPSNLFVPCQWGEAHCELHGPQGVRIKSIEDARPSRQQLQTAKTVLFFPVLLWEWSCLPVLDDTESSQRNSSEGLALTRWHFNSKKCLITNASCYRIHLPLPKDVLERVFVDTGEMAQRLRAHVALAKDQSLVSRTLLGSSQLPVIQALERSRDLWSTLAPALIWTSTYIHMIKEIIKIH